MRAWIALALLEFAGAHARADDMKSAYTVFHPTPREMLRKLSTDRPDRTESPFTVDAGHMQIESGLFEDARDRTKETWNVMNSEIRVGLTSEVDFQLVFLPMQRIAEKGRVLHHASSSGRGDLALRVKYCFTSNDRGDWGVGAIPFVRQAVEGGPRHWESGIMIPVTVALPNDWRLSSMIEMDRARGEDEDNGVRAEWIATLAAERPIVGDLAGYVEIYHLRGRRREVEPETTFDVGLTYALNSDIQLDMGTQMGMTDAAEGHRSFLGLSVRR